MIVAGGTVAGRLHIFVAFDWGEEIDLFAARGLVPGEWHELPRRSRTPASIGYQVPPLRLELPVVAVKVPGLGSVEALADLLIFDLGVVSLRWQIPWELAPEEVTRVAGELAEPAELVQAAHELLQPIFDRLQPALVRPAWSPLSEEYFVFQLLPGAQLPPPAQLLQERRGWLASLVRLEDEPLAVTEQAEALRLTLSYTPDDLLVTDWGAAVVIDTNCDEVLETIAFANLQLLEFRWLDARLDSRLNQASGMIRELANRRLPIWRSHWRPLRDLGELKAEVNELFERTSSALMLVGDPYVARVYQQLAVRFHLEEWGRNIRRAIDVLEGVYQVVSDQAALHRGEFLEIVVVVLILIEVLLGVWRH